MPTAVTFDAVLKRRRRGDPVMDRLDDDQQEVREQEIDALLEKAQPGVSGVHVSTALGNQKPKARLFNDVRNGISVMYQQKRQVIDVTPGAGRQLVTMDSQRSHMPLDYDSQALGKLRPDQVPRFLGSLTHGDQLPTKIIPIKGLVATQNRVDTSRVIDISASPSAPGKMPVVTHFAGKNYIADGHHRVVGAWLRGDDQVQVHYNDLDAKSNAMKRVGFSKAWTIPYRVAKFDMPQGMIFGWASIVTKAGMPVIDKQGDIIPVHELEKAAYDFVLSSRQHGDMHVDVGTGRLVESLVFTAEKQKAMGIDLGHEGWWTGFKVESPAVLDACGRGERPEFSIGGEAVPIPIQV